MSRRAYGAVLQQIDRLFHGGTSAGQPEWQLLNRYVTRGDEAAFEAIVARHGPMVLGVCQRVLDDPYAVEDAFQATFLVLVRKARTLGERDAIGHWLYGVAHRVALRARADALRRHTRETPRDELCVLAPVEESGRSELAALLDAELSRLPAKYRAPIVLCYLEDCTHEQAAAQLGWPVGTVKGRLARARELLRGRLTRRGLAPAAALAATALTRRASAAVPDPLVRVTLRAAGHFTSAGLGTGMVSTTISRLTEGVLSTMFAAKVKVSAAVALSCCGLLFGAWVVAQEGRGRGGADPAQPSIKARADAAVERPNLVSERARAQALVETLERPAPRELREGTLESVLKQIKADTANPSLPAGMPIYVDPEGLEEAGANMQSPVRMDRTINADAPLRVMLDNVLRPLKLAATTRDGRLVVSSRPEVALIEIRKIAQQVRSAGPNADASGAGGDLAGASAAAWLKRLPGRKTVYHSEAGPSESTPEDEARTKAILDVLKKRVPIEFANETPLADAIEYIREATKSEELPDGLPIYVDPRGIEEAEKTIQSPVQMDIKGVALRETLRLLLKQLGLVYEVRDGLLTITSNSSEEEPSVPILDLASMAERGELSLEEMKQLVEMFRVRAEVGRYSGGIPSGPSIQAGSAPAQPANPSAAGQHSAEEDATSQAINAALDKVVALHFTAKPLEDALKEIQKMTVSSELPEGIPVYLSPAQVIGHEDVSINLKHVRLRTGLRLMLSQAGRTSKVEDGILIIAPWNSFELGAVQPGVR